MAEKLIVNLSSEEEIRANVPDINYIPAYKVAEEQRRANELERIENENERIANEIERENYYEETRIKVNNGDFNGKNTVYVGDTEPTDDYYEVWIDPNGTPEVSAENLVFSDSETLQEKYENGDLKGPKGETPDLTDYATKEYVENEIATFDFIKVVDTLPETGLENRVYFVPKTDTQTQDLFDEYVWINGKWEWVTTKQIEVDLTPYCKKTEVENAIDEIKQQDITTGGEPVKCGYKVDEKDVYVQKIYLGDLPAENLGKTISTGLDMSKITIEDIRGRAINADTESTNYRYTYPLPYYTPYDTKLGISLEMTQTGTVYIYSGSDRSMCIGYVNIYFTYND